MATLELNFPEGPWRSLFQRTMALLDEIESKGTSIPQWTLGGGTVLMFHYQHRLSKNIDIFIADPQFLGYINSKLGGPAENVTTDYKESFSLLR